MIKIFKIRPDAPGRPVEVSGKEGCGQIETGFPWAGVRRRRDVPEDSDKSEE